MLNCGPFRVVTSARSVAHFMKKFMLNLPIALSAA